MCDPKIEDGTIRKIEPSAVFFHDGRYIYRFISPEATFPWVLLPLYFFFLRHPVRPRVASLNNEKQHEQLTTSLGGGRICAYRVISSYALISLHFSSFLFVFHSIRADRELPLSCRASYFTWSKTPSSCPALYFTWSRIVLFSRSTFYFTSKMVDACACVYVCASVLLDTFRRSLVFFFLFSGKGYTESLVTQAKRLVPSETRLSFGFYILFVTTLRAPFFCRFVGRIPSMFLTPLPLPPPLAVRVALTSRTFVS